MCVDGQLHTLRPVKLGLYARSLSNLNVLYLQFADGFVTVVTENVIAFNTPPDPAMVVRLDLPTLVAARNGRFRCTGYVFRSNVVGPNFHPTHFLKACQWRVCSGN